MIESNRDRKLAVFSICADESLTFEILSLFKPNYFSIRNEEDETPLHYLCKNKSITSQMLQLVKKLEFTKMACDTVIVEYHDYFYETIYEKIKAGRGVNGNTPLHYLCKNPSINFEILKICAEMDFKVKNRSCETPLHYLCGNLSLNADMLRLVKDMNFNLRNNYMSTPMHYLCDNENLTYEMLELVKHHDFHMCTCYNKSAVMFLVWRFHMKKFRYMESVRKFMKYIIFPFKCTEMRYRIVKLDDDLENFHSQQQTIHKKNFKYLEDRAKKIMIILLYVTKKYKISMEIIFYILEKSLYEHRR